MKKDGYIEGFLNSELPIKASLSASTEYRSYRPLFYLRRTWDIQCWLQDFHYIFLTSSAQKRREISLCLVFREDMSTKQNFTTNIHPLRSLLFDCSWSLVVSLLLNWIKWQLSTINEGQKCWDTSINGPFFAHSGCMYLFPSPVYSHPFLPKNYVVL